MRNGILKSIFTLCVPICSIGTLGFCSSDPASSASPVPVLLELFTSEGCSSCPPAEAFLQRMDSSQPILGEKLIVLSEHVDYWDHDGWKDPYSSHAFTERQNDYVGWLRLRTPSTPQFVVDGSSLWQGDLQKIQQTLTEAKSHSKVPVSITTITFEAGVAPVVRLHIDVDGRSVSHSAELLVATALDHAESDVLRGENGGKRLEHVAVAEEIKKIGKVEKGKDLSRDVELKLKPGAEKSNLRIIAFVQESGPGKVLGVAEQRLTQ